MFERLLDEQNVTRLLVKPEGEGVPQAVRCHCPRDAGLLDPLGKSPLHVTVAQAPTSGVREDGAGCLVSEVFS